MSESAKATLSSFLFDGGRELVNIKFYPGFLTNLSEDDLSAAASAALQEITDCAKPSVPPTTGMAQKTLNEIFRDL